MLRGLALLLLLSCGVLAVAGASQVQATSPRELIAQLAGLEEEERFDEVLDRIVPDQREAYVFISWLGASYDALTAGVEAAQAYRTIVWQHRLDEAWLSEDATERDGVRRLAAKALRGVDLASLLHDLATFRLEHGRFGVAFGFEGELRELHVEEDWALVRIRRTELQLLRYDGAWCWWPFPELEST